MQVMMVYLTTVLPCCLLQRHYLSRHISSYSITLLCLHFLEPLCVVRITMIHFVASRSCGASLVHDASLLHLTTQYSIYHEQDQDQKMCMIPVMSLQTAHLHWQEHEMPQFLFSACPLQTNFGLKPLLDTNLLLQHVENQRAKTRAKEACSRPVELRKAFSKLPWPQLGCILSCLDHISGEFQRYQKITVGCILSLWVLKLCLATLSHCCTRPNSSSCAEDVWDILGPPHIPSPRGYPLTSHDVPSYSPAL